MSNKNFFSNRIFIIILLISVNFLSASLLNKMKAKVSKKNKLFELSRLKVQTETKTSLSLSDMQIDTINDFAKKVTKYFKDQVPPTDRTSLWKDPLFPPTFNSIVSKNPDGTPTDPFKPAPTKFQESNIDWMRPSQIFDGAQYTLFETNVSIDDIRQGGLGNCYFLAAMSSMAETPQLILQLFRSLSVSSAGIYEVILRIDGEWQVVLVDDFIPVKKGTRTPIFANPVNPEIWVLILEKAWAKVNGGYSNIEGGLPTEVFDFFTNFPSKGFDHKDITNKEAFWSTLFVSSNNNDIVTCGTSGGDDTKNVDGIVSGHAFSLLKAIEITFNGSKVRLLKVRNPWGNFEWTGKWSDSSAEWNSTTRALVGDAVVKDDGAFYIEYSDYLSRFSDTWINYFSPLYLTKINKVPSSISDQGIVTEFVLSKPTNCSISLVTQNKRCNRRIKSPDDIQGNMLLALKQNSSTLDNPENFFKFVASGSNENDIILNQLQPGSYVIYSHVNYKSAIELLGFDKTYSYVVQVSCSEVFDFAPRDVDSDHSLARLAIINSTKTKPEVINNQSYITVSDYSINNTTLGYYLKLNGTSANKNITFTDSSTNMIVLAPSVFGVNTKIAPGRSFVAFGPRRDKYGSYVLWLSSSSSSTPGAEITYNNSNRLLANATSDIYNRNANNGFLFRLLNVSLNQLYKTIDIIKAAQEQYTAKYPDLMNYFKNLPPLNDGVPVRFTDKTVFSDGSFTFREKRLDNNQDHGRTYYQWASGRKFIGYSKNGKFDGEGTYMDDGEVDKCLYSNGNFVKWL